MSVRVSVPLGKTRVSVGPVAAIALGVTVVPAYALFVITVRLTLWIVRKIKECRSV